MVHARMIQLLMPYALIALALMGSLGLFVALKGDLWKSARNQRRRMEQITQRLEQAWERPVALLAAPPAPQAARSSLNYTRRVQALRMVRRGDDPSRIAAVLGITRQEVDLLIRVQSLAKSAEARSASGSG
jgi:hypothetical protein